MSIGDKFVLIVDNRVSEIRDEEPPDVWYQTHYYTIAMSWSAFIEKYGKEPYIDQQLDKESE